MPPPEEFREMVWQACFAFRTSCKKNIHKNYGGGGRKYFVRKYSWMALAIQQSSQNTLNYLATLQFNFLKKKGSMFGVVDNLGVHWTQWIHSGWGEDYVCCTRVQLLPGRVSHLLTLLHDSFASVLWARIVLVQVPLQQFETYINVENQPKIAFLAKN